MDFSSCVIWIDFYKSGHIYIWQLKYANTVPTVLCMSKGLIYGYVTGIHFYQYEKVAITSCVTWNLLQPEFYECYLVYYMLII